MVKKNEFLEELVLIKHITRSSDMPKIEFRLREDLWVAIDLTIKSLKNFCLILKKYGVNLLCVDDVSTLIHECCNWISF